MRAWVIAGVLLAAAPVRAEPSAAAHFKQGKAFFDAKQYDQAIGEYKAAYEIDKLPAHLYNIGRALQLSGQAKQAIEYYAKFLDADPKSQLAKEVRETVVVLSREVADREAKADAEKKRLAAESHIKLAQAYLQAGKWVEAGDEQRAAFDVDGDATHLRDAGDAYAKGDRVKARDAYVAYLEKSSGAADADAIRGKIAALPKPVGETHVTPKPTAETAITVIASRPDAKISIDRQEKGTGTWSGSVPTGGHSLRVVAPGARIFQTELVIEEGRPRTIDVPLDPASENPGPRFRVGIAVAPGIKLNADNPAVVLVSGDLFVRVGRSAAIGLVLGRGSISKSGVCGTDYNKADPATVYRFSRCDYFVFGLALDAHLRPMREIDPYVGASAGVRPMSVTYTETPLPTDMNQRCHPEADKPCSEGLFGLFGAVRAGVDYHPTRALFGWTVGVYGELQYGLGKEQQQDIGGGPSYPTVSGGVRTAFGF